MSAPRSTPRLVLAAATAGAALLVLPSPTADAAVTCRGVSATHVGTEGPDTINGTDGRDVVAALGGDDTVFGFEGDDLICLGDGNDVAYGLGGTNTFVPGVGNDYVYGNGEGAVDDTVVYEDAPGPVGVNLSTGLTWAASGQDHLSAIASVVGSPFNDHLLGNGDANLLLGGSGNDDIAGGDSPDQLHGGEGNDVLRGEGADDNLQGGAGRDGLEGGHGSDYLDGYIAGLAGAPQGDHVTYFYSPAGVVADLVAGTASSGGHQDTLTNVSSITGSEHADQIFGDHAQNLIQAGAGDDLVDARGGDDQVVAGLGDDDETGGDGLDTLNLQYAPGPVRADLGTGVVSGFGSDVADGFEHVTGGPYADRLAGTASFNQIDGAGGNDTLVSAGAGPGAGDDYLIGGEGSDVLIPGSANDFIVGGPGSDTVRFSTAAGPVTASPASGQAPGAGTDTLVLVERLTGGRFADKLTGDSLANWLRGAGGNDTLNGAGGNDSIGGDGGNDYLLGGAGTDRCDGMTGTDRATTCETVLNVP
ncbi:calcium-binding protein [Nocardioides stalactiti]|uniref:calcium-binding protein n=1 Tax=Nocardioides stalactiti TaxID=2755356 RepID=UPI00160003E3|nr:calcium-binding protein [Nocardioides stalactiti]